MSRQILGVLGWGMAGLALAAWTGAASAQVRTGGGTGTGASTTGSFVGGGFSGGSTSGGFSGGGFSGGSFSGGGFSGSGFSGGSFSGGGFSGGSTSGGFSGGSFSGSSFSGGSFSGNTTGGMSRTPGGGAGYSGNTYQGISNTNPFYQSYQDPLSLGIGSGSQRTTFGMPMFNLSQTTGNLTGGGALGTTGGVSAVTFTPSPATYMTTPFMVGFNLTPGAAVTPAAPPRSLPPAVASRLRAEVQQVINQSSALPSKGTIRVSVIGPAVLLRGTVSDDHERRLTEGLIRLTPGVNEVINELQVQTSALGMPRPMPPP